MAYTAATFVIIGITIVTMLYYMFANNEQEGPAQGFYERRNTIQRRDESCGPVSAHYPTISNNRRSHSNLEDAEKCSICLSTIHVYNSFVLSNCGHRFHRGCIETWRTTGTNNTCPLCRGSCA